MPVDTRKQVPVGIHGTRTGYVYYGCRCDQCRKAQTDYQKKWRKQQVAEARKEII